MNPRPFDIAIIGSGIAGSTLGAILARQGLRVLIFEAGSHPRFAIGESMILETSEVLRALAELYDVPELAYFSSENYFSQIGTSHGVKRHFSYLHHTMHQPYDPKYTLQAVIPKQPHGHELHIYRQDSDYFLMTTAVAYGATVLQNTRISDIVIDADGVTISAEQGATYRAAYVVDAGGFRSILASKYGLRDTDMQTHSRGIFTHMVNVPDYHEVGPSRDEYGVPYRLNEGTLHHVFRGGWMWVIPFNNHDQSTNPLTSVGLMLDPRIHPARPDLSAEEEFFAFVKQFPGMREQFAHAQSVRGWTRTDRIQYTSTKVVGDRFALLGHAAGFIDPLYSKGLYTTMMSVGLLANLFLDAHKAGDYAAARFQQLEETTLAYIRSNDQLVANSYRSFANPKLWRAYSALWLLGAYTELVRLMSIRAQASDRHRYLELAQGLKLAGGGFAAFDEVTTAINAVMDRTDVDDAHAVDRAVAEIAAIFAPLDWMPQAFHDVAAGKNHLPDRKLRLSLLKRDEGFFGKGAYRRHFFGDYAVSAAVRFFLHEKLHYSLRAIRNRRRTVQHRHTQQPSHATSHYTAIPHDGAQTP